MFAHGDIASNNFRPALNYYIELLEEVCQFFVCVSVLYWFLKIFSYQKQNSTEKISVIYFIKNVCKVSISKLNVINSLNHFLRKTKSI